MSKQTALDLLDRKAEFFYSVGDSIWDHPETDYTEEQSSAILMRALEQEGFTVTVHGKGTYIAASNTELMKEEKRKEVEADLELAIQKGRRYGMQDGEIKELFSLILED